MEFERNSAENSDRDALASLLASDYRTPERIEAELSIAERAKDPTLIQALSLSEFLATSIVEEEYEERRNSQECVELTNWTLSLLDDANITDTFKMEIATQAAKAYASKTLVPESFIHRLGITEGTGIFDPEEAPEREANSMRGFFHDIVKRLGVITEDDGSVRILPPALWPQQAFEHDSDVETLQAWELEYISKHGVNPLQEGFTLGELLIAAQEVKLMTEEEAEETGFAGLIENLSKYKKELSQDDPTQ